MDTFVISVGGLGTSQMGDIFAALRAAIGDENIWAPGGFDDFRSDIAGAAMLRPAKRLCLIGHSFGGDACIRACQLLAAKDPPVAVDYLGLVDPVAEDWGDLILPVVGAYGWFRRSVGFGPPRADVAGAVVTTIIKGGHNQVPHDPYLIAYLVAAVKGKA